MTSMDGLATAPLSGAEPAVDSTTWGGELRALIKLGWPLIVAQLAQNALLTTDVVMMGWLGPRYLAAGALANAFLICIQLFGIGITSAVTPMVAQALGAGDLRSVRRTVRQGLWIGVILVVVLFPLIWNIRPIFHLLGQDPELSAMAEHFVHYAIWLFFPCFLLNVLRCFLAAHGSTRFILLTTLAGVAVNFFGDYGLMFGNFGLPRLELAGAGISTTATNTLMLVLTIGYIVFGRRYRRYHVFARFYRPDWARFMEIWRIGLPIGLMLLAEVGLFTAAALLQGWLGAAEVAAHQIALQLASLSFMVPLGLSQAATVRVGLAMGEANAEGIRKAGWTSLVATLAFMSTTALAFFLFPQALVSLFLDPSDLGNARPLALAASYLTVAALFQLVDGTQVTMAAALRGLSDTNVPLVIALFGYWAVGFPVAYLLGFPLGLRGVGIWLGLASGLATTAVILAARFALRERLGLLRRPIGRLLASSPTTPDNTP
jgi:MATE family multidrug resistance protein